MSIYRSLFSVGLYNSTLAIHNFKILGLEILYLISTKLIVEIGY